MYKSPYERPLNPRPGEAPDAHEPRRLSTIPGGAARRSSTGTDKQLDDPKKVKLPPMI